MNKLKKVLVVTMLAILTVAMNTAVFASTNDLIKLIDKQEYSEDFKNWLELGEDQKASVKMPLTFDIVKTEFKSNNPIDIVQSVGNTLESKFTLQDLIPENLVVRNQQSTNSCWAFATISSLETNLALLNYQNKINTDNLELQQNEKLKGEIKIFY